ncbi:MAG: hypothetical protein ACJATT_004910, partial [Myxococcota bacterium]
SWLLIAATLPIDAHPMSQRLATPTDNQRTR